MTVRSARGDRTSQRTAHLAELQRAREEAEIYYQESFASHGATPAGVGWKDARSQRLRFEKLAYLLTPRPERPVTVNDFGCGYAALFDYLDSLYGVQLARYFGYDVDQAMLDAAHTRTDSRATLIRAREITQEADYSFVSGTFNVKGGASNEAWSRYVERSVAQLAMRSRIGFAFNLMSTYVDFTKPDLFYADPAHFFGFCKSRISRYVTLLHDYPLYECTLVVHMNAPDGCEAQ